ncbi:hypothetical protein IWQ61_010270 [Dispira simplex]|nr:hypothetical protein IWQ61_010270 [Dispira simplex]
MSKPRTPSSSSFLDSLPTLFRSRTRTSSHGENVTRWLSGRSRTVSVDDLNVQPRASRTMSTGSQYYWDRLLPLANSTDPESPADSNPQDVYPRLQEATVQVTGTVGRLIQNEISSVKDDIQLLEDINLVTKAKYNDLSVTVQELFTAASQVEAMYADIDGYLDQAEEVCDRIDDLAVMAYQLDSCAGQLGSINS